jgi:hypothetical protein
MVPEFLAKWRRATMGRWYLYCQEIGKEKPWDENCRVIPMIGGYEAMSAMRESLEAAIAQAKQGKKGYVYSANWRLSPLRDLSEDNPWNIQNRPWNESASAKRIRPY